MTIDVSGRFDLSTRELYTLAGIAAAFLVLQSLGIANTPELVSHDSVAYLVFAETFRSGNWHDIVHLNPDAAPLFPMLAALLSFLPGDMELAARFVSLLSGIATMSAAYLIGRRVGNHTCGVIAIVLLAISPRFFRMSYAVMSEPVYTALFAWIVFVFISTVDKPSYRSGIALGVLGGLAFLARLEGILFIAALPVLHILYGITAQKRRSFEALKPVATSNLVLIVVMAAIAAPQILRVSNLMNSFALNGRSAWAVILANPDGKTYNEKLAGVDYDPKTKNLDYLRTHPLALDEMVRDTGYFNFLKVYATAATTNVLLLHDSELARLVGLPILVFAVIGFLVLLKSGRGADALLLTAFMGLALVAPVLYIVNARHLLMLLPLLSIFASRGLIDTYDSLAPSAASPGDFRKPVAVAGAAIVAAATLLIAFLYILRPHDANHEYDRAALREPISIVRKLSAESAQPATIMARKNYLAYFSGSLSEAPPYTDLAGLLNYMEGSGIDFFFYEEKFLQNYPFAREIGSSAWLARFRELYTNDDQGGRQVLYAVR